jgi:translation initiation factor IF-1
VSDEEDTRPIGTVIELLPSALVKVELDGGHRVTAHAAGSPQRNFMRLIVGDRVVVELAPHDRARGRVVKKL